MVKHQHESRLVLGGGREKIDQANNIIKEAAKVIRKSRLYKESPNANGYVQGVVKVLVE